MIPCCFLKKLIQFLALCFYIECSREGLKQLDFKKLNMGQDFAKMRFS
jgi:hypothetical protein